MPECGVQLKYSRSCGTGWGARVPALQHRYDAVPFGPSKILKFAARHANPVLGSFEQTTINSPYCLCSQGRHAYHMYLYYDSTRAQYGYLSGRMFPPSPSNPGMAKIQYAVSIASQDWAQRLSYQ